MATVSLPPQLTSFTGRTDDLVEIVTLLTDPTCRLLTLVGPGGIGKTRLAIQSAAEAQSHFQDGVCFVALQPVSSTDFLVPALADALHLTFYGPESPRTQLLHYLRPKELLLVLDNFEHLLDDVALLTEILEGASHIKLLATSREALNVREEWVRAVTTMRVLRRRPVICRACPSGTR
jgi:predicted ATPase